MVHKGFSLGSWLRARFPWIRLSKGVLLTLSVSTLLGIGAVVTFAASDPAELLQIIAEPLGLEPSIAALIIDPDPRPTSYKANDARFVSQSVPANLSTGETTTVSITIKNTGTTTWSRASGFKLGTQNSQDNTLWTGGTRVYLKSSDTISPGSTKTFRFKITAPSSPGTYAFQWRMVQEGVEWFGAFTPVTNIVVESRNNAVFVSQSVPTKLKPGESTNVSITIKNTGATTWSRSKRYKLGTQNPRDNKVWTGGTRIYLSSSDSIAPGQSKTFRFKISAPANPGTYNFQWRMVQEGVEWFGALTQNVAIEVSSGTPQKPPPVDPGFPIRLGLWPGSSEETSGNDLDRDGLPQNLELQLAQHFFPTIWFDDGEDCTAPGGSRQVPPSRPGRLIFRARPHPDNPDYISIVYALLYRDDCGDWYDFGFGQHRGDVEAFAITLAPNPSCPIGYGMYALTTWAHYGTVGAVTRTRQFSNRCSFGFSRDPFSKTDVVMVAENKHANYPDDRTCDRALWNAENCDFDFTMGDMNAWVGFNAGEEWAGQQRHHDLAPLGFPGERLWEGRGFCGASQRTWLSCIGPADEKLFLIALRDVPTRNGAQFISQSGIPNKMESGEQATVSITMRNTGGSTWTYDDLFKLGTQKPQDNMVFTGGTRVYLNRTDAIAPGQVKTFTFTISAPSTPGTYNFQWRMVTDDPQSGEWFGDYTPNVPIEVVADRGNQPSFPIRAAFYYPWFPETWGQGDNYPFSRYKPTLGYYDSGDRAVIREHIRAMEYGNIQVGIASWWGQGKPTDQRLATILDVTAGSEFRWAVYYEEEGYSNPTADQIADDLKYLKNRYGSDPSYLRIGGRFVVFVYGGDESCKMVDRWEAANTVDAYIVLKVFTNYRGCKNQPDGWHQYAPALRADSQGIYSYTISPGFWLANKPEQLSRDLSAWYGNVRDMVASNARFHLITTFNEWGEGSAVESAVQWVSGSGYGDYLDALHKNGLGGVPIRVTPTDGPPTTITPTIQPSVTPTPPAPDPTWTPTPTIPPNALIWEDDNFNRLLTGPLDGQNGWGATGDSPLVIPYTGRGNTLWANASPGRTILIGKNVPDQNDGRHRFEFDVMVLGATEPSLTKIELQTNPNTGWNKKFQVYFGSSMRVNYSPSGSARTIVSSTQSGRWYHLRFDLDLGTGTMDVRVDGNLVASGLPMHPGPITSLSISGWDRAGSVYLDNLLGYKMASSLSVEITTPAQGATISGTLPINVATSGEVSRVEFYIDGIRRYTDYSPPYQYAWDTTINPLPIPNHDMDYGYYFVEWKNPADFDTARAEVNGYTNLYYASIYSYVSDLTPAEWKPLLAQSIANAVAEGKQIHLALDPESSWNHILDVATAHWDHVIRIEVGDEPNLTLAATEAMLQRLRNALAARGLPLRPLGFVYRYDQTLPNAINAPSLNWVGIEAYLNAPGSPVSQVNVDALSNYLSDAKAQVPAGKDIVLVMMAYDRNGTWPNIDTLRDLQIPVYLAAYNDPRVVSINMFSYTRLGGSRDHPELRTPHQLMGERILDRSIPGAGNGPRALRVVAYDAGGGRASDRITVTVRNPVTTSTPSPTPIPTLTQTGTLEPTNTPVITLTSTAVITWTPSPSVSPTVTQPSPTQTPFITPTGTSTPTILPSDTPTSSPTPAPVVWEDDTFDRLVIGSLNGQNGWRSVRDSPQVVPFPGRGNVLKVDPGPNRTIIIAKDVPDQGVGRHRFEFDVMVSGATEASLAKIEMGTNPNAGWDKKFQVYFGSSMRINYSPSGSARTIISSTSSGRWYHFRIEMDLNTGNADVWVDGTLAASGIPMHPGSIVSLSISGWDRAGEVYLDNLLGSG